ncbi:MAG: hypothetical protein UZ19_OD1000671 [Parcubacteria bacterium OLB19]|nr:MAG: hypothetical protein UZ19_OD1000671 [Parcubacteria bacterium OLB19]
MFKSKIIKLLASFIFLLRKKTLTNSKVKWVVCSGSVGKTIMRRSLFLSLSKIKTEKFLTPNTDYCNEIGVLCAFLDIKNFFVFSIKSLVEIFTKKPISDSYVLIELGADFRLDIDWFLKRWSPSIVILTMGTSYHWTKEIEAVLRSRLRLCQSILPNGKIYVSEDDFVHLSLLKKENIIFNKIDNNLEDIYFYPREVLIAWSVLEGWGEIEFISFNKNRFEVIKSEGKTIIKDTYKVTPVCFAYFLKSVLHARGDKKILLITEIRPLKVDVAGLYKIYLADLKKINKIYFYGDVKVYNFLSQNLNNVYWLNKKKLSLEILDLKKRVK